MRRQSDKIKRNRDMKDLVLNQFVFKHSFFIVALVAIVVGLIALFFLALVLPKTFQKFALASEASESRSKIEMTLNSTHQNKVDQLLKSGMFDRSSPIIREKIDSCTLSSINKGGFAISNWRQYCELYYTDYIPTNYSKDNLVSMLTGFGSVVKTFGEPQTGMSSKSCTIFANNNSSTLRYYSAAEEYEQCKKLKHSLKGEQGSIVPVFHGESYLKETFKDSDLNPSKAYVKVETHNVYFKSNELGCKPFSLLCEAPFEAASGYLN